MIKLDCNIITLSRRSFRYLASQRSNWGGGGGRGGQGRGGQGRGGHIHIL